MAAGDIKIVRVLPQPTRTFVSTTRASLTWDLATPVFFAEMPGEDASKGVLMKIEGNKLTVVITLKLADGAQSISEDGSINTAAKMREYLLKEFQNKGIGVDSNSDYVFQFQIDGDPDATREGAIERINITESEDLPGTYECTINFVQGDVIATTEVTS